MIKKPKISFGIIVLNGMPFVKYCLRQLYPFAHEIIVVEGASKKAAAISTPDGHSIDGTLDALYQFKDEEDPEDKVQIIVKDGFWNGKDEQSQAYAERATGDYLWQVDIDEFYKPEDMQIIIQMLSDDPDITAISFKMITFWGGFDYITDGWYLRRGAEIYHRLFKFGQGYQYVTHRPPTVIDPSGRNLRDLNWIDGYTLNRMGIKLYHYSLTFPKQVLEKAAYYEKQNWGHSNEAIEWTKNNFLKLNNPFRVHNVYIYPSWLERFRGTHPPEIYRLKEAIQKGIVNIECRQTEDTERLLNSKAYQLGCIALKGFAPIDAITWRIISQIERILFDGLKMIQNLRRQR